MIEPITLDRCACARCRADAELLGGGGPPPAGAPHELAVPVAPPPLGAPHEQATPGPPPPTAAAPVDPTDAVTDAAAGADTVTMPWSLPIVLADGSISWVPMTVPVPVPVPVTAIDAGPTTEPIGHDARRPPTVAG